MSRYNETIAYLRECDEDDGPAMVGVLTLLGRSYRVSTDVEGLKKWAQGQAPYVSYPEFKWRGGIRTGYVMFFRRSPEDEWEETAYQIIVHPLSG